MNIICKEYSQIYLNIGIFATSQAFYIGMLERLEKVNKICFMDLCYPIKTCYANHDFIVICFKVKNDIFLTKSAHFQVKKKQMVKMHFV